MPSAVGRGWLAPGSAVLETRTRFAETSVESVEAISPEVGCELELSVAQDAWGADLS
jgi:hypothetical protein